MAHYAGFECKAQKDFQTYDKLISIQFDFQARKNKRKGKAPARPKRAPPVPSRKTANYAAGRRSVMRTRAMKARRGMRGTGGGANVRVVQAPVATSNQMSFPRERKPFIGTHFEKLTDVFGTDAFTTTSYNLNPGLSSTFPWMSNIAVNFEMYKFLNLEFWYVQATATSTTGTVYMCFDPDASDPPPLSSVQLIDYDVKIMGSPYVNQKLRIPPKSKFVKDLFVRNGSVSSTDVKTYDLGTFTIATDGCSVTTKIGALFVSYKVALIMPELNSASITSVALEYDSLSPATDSLFDSPVIFGSTQMGTMTGNVFTFANTYANVFISWVVYCTSFTGLTVTSTCSFTTQNIVEGSDDFATQMCITDPIAGSTITFAATLVGGISSTLYLCVVPTTVVLTEEELLFKRFRKMMIEEQKVRTGADTGMKQRISTIEKELQDEQEALSLSDNDEDHTEVIVDASGRKVVRVERDLSRVEPQYNVDSSFAHGSELARKAKKVAIRSHAELMAPPTETISVLVKGKEKQ